MRPVIALRQRLAFAHASSAAGDRLRAVAAADMLAAAAGGGGGGGGREARITMSHFLPRQELVPEKRYLYEPQLHKVRAAPRPVPYTQLALMHFFSQKAGTLLLEIGAPSPKPAHPPQRVTLTHRGRCRPVCARGAIEGRWPHGRCRGGPKVGRNLRDGARSRWWAQTRWSGRCGRCGPRCARHACLDYHRTQYRFIIELHSE